MIDFPEMPEFLKRGPDTPALKEARLAMFRKQPLAPTSRLDWKPSKQATRRDEREREATLERWRKEHLAEQIAESKRST